MMAMPRTIHYRFAQIFHTSARKAFKWCTNFTPQDHALMREKNATRQVQHLSEDSILLLDTFTIEGKSVVKQKLVCLYPSRLMWTSTHLAGPAQYSQFLYKIIPKSRKSSCLEFTGFFLDRSSQKNIDATEAKLFAKRLRREDADTWKLLAKEMEKEMSSR